MKENLMFAHFGNGLSVCDRNREEHGDYMTVAHISVMREVTYRKHRLSDEAKKEIERVAETNDGAISATQEQKIFNTRPKT
jgi:hypothetical protein